MALSIDSYQETQAEQGESLTADDMVSHYLQRGTAVPTDSRRIGVFQIRPSGAYVPIETAGMVYRWSDTTVQCVQVTLN